MYHAVFGTAVDEHSFLRFFTTFVLVFGIGLFFFFFFFFFFFLFL